MNQETSAKTAHLSCLVVDSVELAPMASGLLNEKHFVVKDLASVAGHVSSFGHSRWRQTHTASDTSAPLITTLLSSGASLSGLAKLDQLAGSLVGNIGEGEPPVNSLYPDRFCGGSSSGSASAVAGSLVNFAIGTDTAGSVRVPAAACGLYGFRPSFDAISTEGLLPWAGSFDTVGILAQQPKLLLDVFSVLSDKAKDTNQLIAKLLLPRDCLAMVSPETAEVVISTAQQLAKDKNLQLEEVSFSAFVSQNIGDLFGRLQTREIWKTHGTWISENLESLAPDLQTRMQAAEKNSQAPATEIEADEAERISYREQLAELITTGNVLVLPVIHDLPPKLTATADELQEFRKLAVRLNAPSGLAGTPEVVIPVSGGSSGRTYGVGLLGARGTDLGLLDLIS